MRSHGSEGALQRRRRGGFVLPGWAVICLCIAGGTATSAHSASIIATCPRAFSITADKDTTRGAVASDPLGVVSDVRLSTPTPLIVLGKLSPAVGVGAQFTAELIAKAALPPGVFTVRLTFSNLDSPPQSASCSVTIIKGNSVRVVRINQIQGPSHLSPLVGQQVDFPGIVTARTGNGFYLQDPVPDGDDATSEGIFVFTDSAPDVTVGDSVRVNGVVREQRAAGSSADLTVTSITQPSVVIESSGNALPPLTLIGEGGRALRSNIIDNDAADDVEISGRFEADVDGIDFYESLEGMRVQANDILAVGPTTPTGEIAVLPNNQAASLQPRSEHAGVLVTAGNFNPQRLILDDVLAPLPQVNVRDRSVSAAGVLDYSAGNFKLLVTSTPQFVSGELTPEVTDPARPEQLTVATLNVENLSAADSLAKIDMLAAQIVTHLRAPDVLALIAVQDDNGAIDDAVVTAEQSFLQLIQRIVVAGGPRYEFRQIDPVDDQEGGEPGGNARVGLLFNADRVSFVDRAGGNATNSVSVVAGLQGPQLSASPGRIDPRNPAFNANPKALAAEFLFNGQTVFVIVNDLVSRDADTPLFGRFQPPRLNSEPQRLEQATVLLDFVNSIRLLDRRAKIVVLGAFNDFPFGPSLQLLKNFSLFDPSGTPVPYNMVLDGNSQALDHILLSSALLPRTEYDSVHVNSEFAAQVGAHDPLLVRLRLPPVVDLAGNFEIQRSGLILNRLTGRFVGTVTLTNKSTTAIAGPLEIALESLPSDVILVNATGRRNASPNDSGDPTIAVPGNSFAPGASVQITLQFFKTSSNFVDYTLRVFKADF